MKGYESFEVEIAKVNGKLGLEITEGERNGIYVKGISGAAADNGRLSIGDRILAIKLYSGKSEDETLGVFRLDGCKHEQAADAMRRCGDTVSLTISRRARMQGIQGNIIIIEPQAF